MSRDDLHAELVRIKPYLLKVAKHRTASKQDAEDLLHDTVLKILSRPAAYNPKSGSTFYTWAARVMHNIFIDSIRRKKKLPDLCNVDDFVEFITPPAHEVDDSEEICDIAKKIIASMHGMDNRWSTSIMMIADGYSYKQICEHLGEKLSTVSSFIMKGRQHIQAEVGIATKKRYKKVVTQD